MKVLMVEDDYNIVESVSLAFRVGWPETQVAFNRFGEKGIELAAAENPDIVILGLGLPDMSGFEVLKQIRHFSPVPVIVLSVRSDEKAVVKALEWGADDYIIKPFRQMELLARVRAAMRRQCSPESEWPLDCGNFVFYVNAHKIKRGDRMEYLTSTEALILYYLVVNRGQVVTHDKLAEKIWRNNCPGSIEAIRSHIKNLRRKIEDDTNQPCLILSKPGLGYLFSAKQR